MRVQDEREGES